MSFTRKMFRTLTKRNLTCLFKKKKKKRRLFSILVQNSPKVNKKVLVFRKVAWSCSLTKKLLKILKVAKTLLSRIWKGRASVCGDRWGGDWGEVYWCTTHTWRADQLRESRTGRIIYPPWSRSSTSLYLAAVTICWTQNPIVKGENFLFWPLLLVEFFFTVLGATNSQEISVNTDHGNETCWSCIFRSRWVHKLQEFNLFIDQSPKIKLVQ